MRRPLALGTCCALFAGACSDTSSVAPQNAGSQPEPLAHYGMDAVFDSVAAEEPAFAGSYLREDGQLVVSVVKGRELRNLARVVGDVAPTYKRNEFGQPQLLKATYAAPSIEVVEHSWRELIAAKDIVLQLPEPGAITTVDADERRNRVVIGVASAGDSASVRSVIQNAGISDEMAVIVVRARLASNQSLDDRVRPIAGGLNIGPRSCTATLIATLNGSPVMLTNFHCTAVWSMPDGGSTWQPNSQCTQFGGCVAYPSFFPFGGEILDAQTYRCGPRFTTRPRFCRRADLAAYSLTNVDVAPGEVALNVGRIYRPVQRYDGRSMIYGTRVIDAVNPFFTVFGTLLRVPVGTVVDRVGMRTGWQSGPVTASCVDSVNDRGTWIVCQTFADTFSEGGDSGSPMFVWVGEQNVLFAGINWGSSNTGPDNVFSDVTQILQELPGLVFTP